jgi:hypothetical protein
LRIVSTDALGQVRERLEVDALRFGAELLVHVVVREREHPAVGVADHQGLLCPEQVVRDQE